MPALTDSLAALAEHSTVIHELAERNLAPPGRFTTAYLDSVRRNPDPARRRAGARARGSRSREQQEKQEYGDGTGVLSLIRDAQDSEVRLFRYIGDTESAGQGRVQRLEKRDAVVTPLKRVAQGKGAAGARDDVEVLLNTALRLVDDYRPMPRARATIKSLLASYHAQSERILELELEIDEAANTASNAAPPADKPTSAAAEPASSSSKLARKQPETVDEAIKAEEAALRKLEAKLAPLRAARPPPPAAASEEAEDDGTTARTPGARRPLVQSSPPASSAAPAPSQETASNAVSARTPGKTPIRPHPGITNSLVSQTPRQSRPTFDRFSPLKLLGTPRAGGANAKAGGARSSVLGSSVGARASSVKARTTLREVMGADEVFGGPEIAPAEEKRVGSGIFGARPSRVGQGVEPTTGQSAAGRGDAEEEGEEQEQGIGGGDEETVRLSRVGGDAGLKQAATPGLQTVTAAAVPVSDGAVRVEGICVENPLLESAASKIWDTIGDILRQGLSPEVEPERDVVSTVKSLARLARSDPDPPPSPSSASTSTLLSGAPVRASPITQQAILFASALLFLMRTAPPPSSASPNGEISGATAPMGATIDLLKEELTTLARVRGWEATDSAAAALGTRTVYGLIGKKVVRIDRRAGGLLEFASA